MNKGKIVLFTVSLIPLIWLIAGFFNQQLGANPVETINRTLGDWALRFLIITLAITPLRIYFGLGHLMQYRRMLGLFSFFYLVLHISSYMIVDQGLYWPEIIEDLYKRPYITIGMMVFLLLIPLAVTSTNNMIRRLGGRRWQQLHRLVYPAAMLAVVHFWLMVKADITEPFIYASILFLLLLIRLPVVRKTVTRSLS